MRAPPYMHSEALADRQRCCELCWAAGDEATLKYAELHADIIRRFGRFPHRNAALGPAGSRRRRSKRFWRAGGFGG